MFVLSYLQVKDCLKEALKLCGIPHSTWHVTAEDRPTWRSYIHSGVNSFEAGRIKDKEEKRQKRKDKENAATQPGPAPTIPCPHCPRHFKARIGLVSHLRTHRNST